MSDDFQSHELVTATKLNRALRTGRCIGRARRITNSNTSTGTTRIPVLRLDDIPIVANRLYTICTNSTQIDGATNNDTLVIEILSTTDGSTPTITSSLLPGAASEVPQPNAASPVWGQIVTRYIPGSDETLSLLLTVKHGIGTGAMGLLANGTSSIIEMLVIDQGEDPGDTGVDL